MTLYCSLGFHRDCGPLSHPDNGTVSTPDGTAEGAQVQYTCTEGYELCSGCADTRECYSTGSWSHQKPTCKRKGNTII